MNLISVTQALAPFNDFSMVPPDRLEAAKQRGLRLHAAAAAKLTGTFQIVPLLPEDAGYWESLSAWIDDYVDHVYDVEPELTDEKFGFVGHPDLVCKLSIGKGMYAVPDWKTPVQASKSWRIQSAAYVHLASINYRHHSHTWRGFMVQPHPEGKQAKGTPYFDYQRDFAIFLSCLNAYRYFKGGNHVD